MPDDFAGAFAGLRDILKKHALGMSILADTPTNFTVITPAIGPNKKPIWFGAVVLKKSAVTYHLIPLYFNPVLQATVPAELLARKQGKTCFNFRRPDPSLFDQIDQLTGRGREHFQRHGFMEAGPISAERLGAALRAAGENPELLAKQRKLKAADAARKRAATLKKKAGAAAKPPAGRASRASKSK